MIPYSLLFTWIGPEILVLTHFKHTNFRDTRTVTRIRYKRESLSGTTQKMDVNISARKLVMIHGAQDTYKMHTNNTYFWDTLHASFLALLKTQSQPSVPACTTPTRDSAAATTDLPSMHQPSFNPPISLALSGLCISLLCLHRLRTVSPH